MQQVQLLTKQHGTFCRERLHQVLQQGSQTPGDLNTGAAKLTDFGDGQMNKVLPVRGPVDEAQPALSISNSFIVQTVLAQVTKEMMNLIQGQNRRGRVIDRG